MPLAARCKDLSVAHEPICKAAIAFALPTHHLVPSLQAAESPGARSPEGLQDPIGGRRAGLVRFSVFLLLRPLAAFPNDRDLPYATRGNALPRRTLRRPGPSWRSTSSQRSTRDGRRAATAPDVLAAKHTPNQHPS